MAVVAGVVCRARLMFRIDFTKVLCTNTFNNNRDTINNSSQLGRKLRQCRRFTTIAGEKTQVKYGKTLQSSCRKSSSSSSSSDSDSTDVDEDDVTVEYCRGLPQLTVPLPSRREKCLFTLKPISNCVGDFIEMLKKEDKGIDRVIASTMDGTRIASSNTIEHLLAEDFKLVINDNTYKVHPPKHERLTNEEAKQLSDVKNLVSQLYEALNVQDHHITKELELSTEIETLKQELEPLESVRGEIEVVAQRKSNWLAWAGLGLMSVQFGILARLTWWEYSWDIMEPVTYFVTYGTAMGCYAYYVLTREEYILNDVRDRQHLFILHKKAKKLGLDLTKYNQLKDQITVLELDLKKVKDPLRANLPRKSLNTTTTTTDTVVEESRIEGEELEKNLNETIVKRTSPATKQ